MALPSLHPLPRLSVCAAALMALCGGTGAWAQEAGAAPRALIVPPEDIDPLTAPPLFGDDVLIDASDWDSDALLDPNTPLAPLPDIEVEWPDLGTPLPPAPETPVIADVEPVVLPPGLDPGGAEDALALDGASADEMPELAEADDAADDAPDAADSGVDIATIEDVGDYRVVVSGVDGIADDEFDLRFDTLSELTLRRGDDSNFAQVRRRADQDVNLLTTLLRNKGYYDSFIRASVRPDPAGGRLIAELAAEAGPLYRYKSIALPGLEAAGSDADAFRTAFGVKIGDAVDADLLVLGQGGLRTAMRENGYAFGDVGKELVIIDHDDRSGALDQPVTPGGKYRFGAIRITSGDIFGTRHLGRIARFDPGDLYKESDVEDLRNAIIATTLVSSVTAKPVASGPDVVDVEVAMTPAPPRTIAGELGYGTGEGFRAEVSWTHRNFIRPEGALTLRAIAGTDEQLASATLRRNNFLGRDRILTGQVLVSNLDYDAYRAKTALVSATFERKTTLLFQKKWTWSVGTEILATRERSKIARIAPREYYIASLPAMLAYDGTEDLLNPQSGFRLGARVSPEFSYQGASYGYAKMQLDGSAYYPVKENIVLAGRVRLGTIAGGSGISIAPSRLFYAGGAGSVRGFGFQAVGPRDEATNVPLGGKSLTEASFEARIRFGNFGVVPFIDAGHLSAGAIPRFKDLSIGAGVGVRYYTSFGPIRVDVGTPLNPRSGDPRVAVYVSLGQAF